MLHLWSLATWNLEVTHDAGHPEWIDAPVTNWNFDNPAESEGNYFEREMELVRLPQPLHLFTAWYIDELCDQLYLTCIDPRGKTLIRLLEETSYRDEIPRIHLASIALSHLVILRNGFYAFTFAYFGAGGYAISAIRLVSSCGLRKESKTMEENTGETLDEAAGARIPVTMTRRGTETKRAGHSSALSKEEAARRIPRNSSSMPVSRR